MSPLKSVKSKMKSTLLFDWPLLHPCMKYKTKVTNANIVFRVLVFFFNGVDLGEIGRAHV